jgi:N-acetylglucosaminyl-diphospho-decaprenol L-rhamnosyltransferase
VTDVSIVIVTFQARELLRRCLDALAADGTALDRQVIVVDQASDDGTASWVAEAHPEVELVALDRNVGFGAGNNRGVALARGRHVLLLNSDAFVSPGAVDELVRFLDATPRAGAVGPRLRNADGTLQRSCRSFPTPWRLATEYLFLRKLAPRSRALNAFYCGGFDHDRTRRVDWVTGACVLIRGESMAQVGGFDESFFLYSEETDLLRRLADLGLETWFDPAAEVTHLWGATTARDPGPAYREQLRSHIRYLDRHLGRGAARGGRLILLSGLALRAPRGRGYRDAGRWLLGRSVRELLAVPSAPS